MTDAQLDASMHARFDAYRPEGAPSDCWEWRGPMMKNGYGYLARGKWVRHYAHRLAVEYDGRPLVPGDHVCHSCDNKRCCNPAHLFIGTNDDNARDARDKGLRVKSTCRRGHEKTPDNTYVRTDRRGYIERHCRTCMRERWAKPSP